jgi:hypothetical protein
MVVLNYFWLFFVISPYVIFGYSMLFLGIVNYFNLGYLQLL